MNAIDNYLDQAYEATLKIHQFLHSELEFNDMMSYVEEMVDKREHLFRAIESSHDDLPAHYRQKVQAIVDFDHDINQAMNQILQSQASAIQDIQSQKRQSAKMGTVQRKYLNVQQEAGYFINRKE